MAEPTSASSPESPKEWIKLVRLFGYAWIGSFLGTVVGFSYLTLPAAEKGLGMHLLISLVFSIISTVGFGSAPVMALAAYRDQTDA